MAEQQQLSRLQKNVAWSGGITILLWLLLSPLLLKLRENINEPSASGRSNLKQLGLGLDQYAQDSDNTLPPLVNLSTKLMWREALYPYVKSVGVYRCPENLVATQSDTPTCLSWSYAANRAGWGKNTGNSQVIRLVDERNDDEPEWDMAKPMYAPPTAMVLYLHRPPHPFFTHPAGTLNVLLADGHVKRVAPMETLAPVNLWTQNNKPFAGQDLANVQAIVERAESE